MLQNVATLLAGGGGVWLSVNIVKKIKWVPVNAGQKALLRGTAGVLSAVALVLVSLASGAGLPESFQEVMVKLVELASIWFTAHASHKVLKK